MRNTEGEKYRRSWELEMVGAAFSRENDAFEVNYLHLSTNLRGFLSRHVTKGVGSRISIATESFAISFELWSFKH